MIRPIVLYGDPILEEISAEVNVNQKADVHMLVEDMFETMHKAQGIGLSAVQIGVPLRVFIIEAHIEEENFHFRGTFINPKILIESGKLVKHPEGCLSVPLLAGLVERPERIKMEWYDENWDYHKENFDGYKARIIQHEYDHLEGKVYVEKLDKMWKSMMKRPLDLIVERKMEGIQYAWR
jgi:peptide deformylase